MHTIKSHNWYWYYVCIIGVLSMQFRRRRRRRFARSSNDPSTSTTKHTQHDAIVRYHMGLFGMMLITPRARSSCVCVCVSNGGGGDANEPREPRKWITARWRKTTREAPASSVIPSGSEAQQPLYYSQVVGVDT